MKKLQKQQHILCKVVPSSDQVTFSISNIDQDIIVFDGGNSGCPPITFRLDESTTTTTLPPPVPRSTQPLCRNSTTLVKHNLLSSITIRHPHCQIGHGNINKTIAQLLVDPLTPRLQHLPTKSRLRRTSLSRRPLIVVTNNKKIAPAPRFSGVQNKKQQNNNKTGHTKQNPLHTSPKPSNPNG
jgi:hypothetical protein